MRASVNSSSTLGIREKTVQSCVLPGRARAPPVHGFRGFFAIFLAHLYMTVTQDAVGRRVVLSPQEGLVAGGPAEEFEQRVQALFERVDRPARRPAQRADDRQPRRARPGAGAHVGAAAGRHVPHCLPVSDGPDDPRSLQAGLGVRRLRHDRRHRSATCAGTWSGRRWPEPFAPRWSPAGCAGRWPAAPKRSDCQPESTSSALAPQPFIALIKLVAAALIGMLVTAIHAPSAADRPTARAGRHAQILLCVRAR